jgi:hypothetical protein
LIEGENFMSRTQLLMALLISATHLFSTNYAKAQGVMGPPIIVPMPNRDVCGGYSDSWSANCRRDKKGNMHDGNSGNVYDPGGNPIQHDNRSKILDPSPNQKFNDFKNTVNFNGIFSGRYTMSILFGMSSKGIMKLRQDGNQVTGTLTTKTGRSANVSGVIRGQQFIGTLIFTDKCSGQGSMVAELSPTGNILTGKYSASDCVGKYSGRYKLLKQ